MFRFWDLKAQQCYMLQEEVNISKSELTSLVYSLRDFLKSFDHACKCIQVPLPKLKVEIGYAKSKHNPFAHYYNGIIGHPNAHISLSFRLRKNNSCVFSIKIFERQGNQFLLTEIINLNHHEIHHVYKKPHYVANKCEIIESNYDVSGIHLF